MSIEQSLRRKRIEEEAYARLRKHIKPKRGLGIIEDLAVRLAGITEKVAPAIQKGRLLLFVADHGIAFRGVSAMDSAATVRLIDRVSAGKAVVNLFCSQMGIELRTYDCGSRYEGKLPPSIVDVRLDHGTKDISVSPAMTLEQRDKGIEIGRNAVEQCLKEGVEIIGIGEIGIGNTTIASALTSALLQLPPNLTTDVGTGISDEQLELKRGLVSKAIALHDPDPKDPLGCLTCLGGFEYAAMVGAILACSDRQVPIVLDGYATSIAGLIASRISPDARSLMFISHVSRERGHKIIIDHFHERPIVDLQMSLGEGTGSILGISIMILASRVLAEVECF